MLKDMIRKITKNKIALFLLILLAVILPEVFIYLSSSINSSFWILFLPSIVISAWYFGITGVALTVLQVGLFTNYLLYLRGVVEPFYSFEEFKELFFSPMLQVSFQFVFGILCAMLFLRIRRDREKLHRLTLVDRLTGLGNYAYFIDRLVEERERSDRLDSEMTLIMIDIDYFKHFNDEYGHEKGNILLKYIADIIRKSVRPYDVVARYGGEEFAIILPSTSIYVGLEIAERIRERVEREQFTLTSGADSIKINKTVSAGTASYPSQANDEFELIDKADKALYIAKEEGRNQSTVYSDSLEYRWFSKKEPSFTKNERENYRLN